MVDSTDKNTGISMAKKGVTHKKGTESIPYAAK